MQLRCVLCQRDVEIDDDTPMAKRAREEPGFVFICRPCQRRNVERYGLEQERPNPLLPNRKSLRRTTR